MSNIKRYCVVQPILKEHEYGNLVETAAHLHAMGQKNERIAELEAALREMAELATRIHNPSAGTRFDRKQRVKKMLAKAFGEEGAG